MAARAHATDKKGTKNAYDKRQYIHPIHIYRNSPILKKTNNHKIK